VKNTTVTYTDGDWLCILNVLGLNSFTSYLGTTVKVTQGANTVSPANSWCSVPGRVYHISFCGSHGVPESLGNGPTMQYAGSWAWDRALTSDENTMFQADPFGMYASRPALRYWQIAASLSSSGGLAHDARTDISSGNVRTDILTGDARTDTATGNVRTD
jgi:hypothetical protein